MRPYSIILYLSFFIFFFSQANPVFSQKVDPTLNEKISKSIFIKGTVLNQQNDPIFNAAAVILGASTGTLTNGEGQFVLIAPTLPLTLRITAPGCKSLDTIISISNPNFTLKLNCDNYNTSTFKGPDSGAIKEFLKGRFELPILLRENIQLGEFDFENISIDTTYKSNIQEVVKLPATSATNYKFRTIKPLLLTVEPVMTGPINIIDGTYFVPPYLYLNRD